MKKIVFLILLFLSCNLMVNENALASTVKWGNYTINSGQIGIVKFSTDVKLYKQNPNGSTSVILGKKGQAYRVYDLDKIKKYYKTAKGYKIEEATKYNLGGGVTVQGNEIIKFEQLPQNIYEQVIALYGYPVKSLVPPESTKFGFDFYHIQSHDDLVYMWFNPNSYSFIGCKGWWDEYNTICTEGNEAEIKFNETKSAFSYDLRLGQEVTIVQIQYPVKKGSIVTITRPNGSIEKEKITKFIPYEFYDTNYEYTHVIVTEKGRKFAVGRYMNVTAIR